MNLQRSDLKSSEISAFTLYRILHVCISIVVVVCGYLRGFVFAIAVFLCVVFAGFAVINSLTDRTLFGLL